MRNLAKPTALVLASIFLLTGCGESRPKANPAEGPLVSQDAESSTPDLEQYQFGSWSTSFSRDSLRQAAMREMETFFDLRADSDAIIVDAHFDPGLPQPARECSLGAVELLFLSFATDVASEAENLSIVLIAGRSDNQDWIVETARSIDSDWPAQVRNGKSLLFPDWLDAARVSASSTYGYGEHNAIVLSLSNSFMNSCEQTERLVYHEAFHSLAARLDGKSLMAFPEGDMRHMGRWFREGTADFFAEALVVRNSDSKYWGTSPKVEPGELVRLTSMDSGDRSYTVGQFAVEYLVANVGVEPVLDVYRRIGIGLSFYEAFGQAVGVPIDEFYSRVENIEFNS